MIKQLLVLIVLALVPLVCAGEEVVLAAFTKVEGGVPLYFVLEGETFTPGKQLKLAETKEINRSSPATVLEEFMRAVFQGDEQRHKALFVPGETPESYLAPDSGGTELSIVLKATLHYGQFVIAVAEVQDQHGLMLMKQVDGKYYLSEALNNKDRAYDLLQHINFSLEKDAVLTGMLSETVYPLGDAKAPHPLKLLHAGTNFNPAMILKDSVKRTEANVKTPQGALAATYSASVANDAEWYLSLISPTELASDPRLRPSVTNSLPMIAPQLKTKGVTVEREIRFSNYAVFIFAPRDKSTAKDERSYLAFEKHEGRWYLTDELNGDPFVNFFSSAEINSTAAFPRIFLAP